MREKVLKIIRSNYCTFIRELKCSNEFLSYIEMNSTHEIIPYDSYEAITSTRYEGCNTSYKFIKFLLQSLDEYESYAIEFAMLFYGALHETGQLNLAKTLDEAFQCHELMKYSFKGVRPSEEDMREKCSSLSVYSMAYEKRGCCLIMNMEKFDSSSDYSSRYGSEIDVSNLKNLFASMDFDIEVKTNLTGEKIIREVDKFVHKLARCAAEKYASIVMVLMSHGGRGGVIYGCDGVKVNQYDLYKKVYGCEALRGKPKVFVVQACAGGDQSFFESDSRPTNEIRQENLLESTLSMEESPEDTLIVTSSFDGFKSLRHIYKGSPFITALVMTLAKHSYEWHLEKICKKVQNEMRDLNKDFKFFPVPCYLNFFRKKLYFFPGLKGIEAIQGETEPIKEPLFDYESFILGTELRSCAENLKCLQTKDEVYWMSDGKRGRCLIINIAKFADARSHRKEEEETAELLNRPGSEHDAELLSDVFRRLHFDVPAVMKDLKSKQIIEAVEEELDRADHSHYGMFVLVIMSHGNKSGWILGSDCIPVDQHILHMKIYNCKALKNKPKIFIVDAGAAGDYKNYDHKNSNQRGSVEDVLIFASSLEGIGHQMPGQERSWFIRILAVLLYNHFHEWHLEKICKKVQDEMRKIREKESSCPVQIPCYAYFLRKKLFLFSGLNTKESSSSENETMRSSTVKVEPAMDFDTENPFASTEIDYSIRQPVSDVNW